MKKLQRSVLTVVCALGFAFAMSGCQTLNDVVAAKQSGSDGTAAEYAVTEAQAWDIAKTVLRWEGVDAIEENRSDGYMLTSTGLGIGTAGTVIGVWVERGSKPELTRVVVVTKRRIVTNLITSLTESTFQRSFAQAVEIVKSGKQLPRVRPTS